MSARHQRLLWGAAVVLLAGFLILGLTPWRYSVLPLDIAAQNLRGHAVGAAWALTVSGFVGTQLVMAVAFVAYAWASGRLRAQAGYAMASLVALQLLVVQCKVWFHRPRPGAWLVRHETTYSYPSGHAATAVAFLGTLLILVCQLPLPPRLRYLAVAATIAWVAGIAWSRMALGVHFATDVIGGCLLGGAWLCATLALSARLGIPMIRHQMPANHS